MRTYRFENPTTSRILIQRGATATLSTLLAGIPCDGFFLIYDPKVLPHVKRLESELPIVGCWALEGGEAAKSLRSLESAATCLLECGASRQTLVLGMGGGVTTDLAAFVAATYMRGTACALLPTSLLAMVDAGLGGKNGIDLGPHKNLLGTIRQPDLVVIDTDWLDTLDDDHYREGLAEVVKTAAVLDADLFEWLENHGAEIRGRRPEIVDTLVERTALLKMGVVSDDEREAGRRMLLNFGHTIGHAWEGLSDYEMSHGNAVAMGMVAECRAVGSTATERVAGLLKTLGLPTEHPDAPDLQELWALVQKDKKAAHGQVRVATPEEVGRGVISELHRADLESIAR